LGKKWAVVGGVRLDPAARELYDGPVGIFDLASGQRIAQLTSPTDEEVTGFGTALSSHGDVLAVAAPWGRPGRVYVYDLTSRKLVHTLVSPNGPDDLFGVSIDLSGNTLVVGARGSDRKGFVSGAAYVFDAKTGDLVSQLIPEDLTPTDGYGFVVAASSEWILVGAPIRGDSHEGAIYVFDVPASLRKKAGSRIQVEPPVTDGE
jgi:hypothetical protein